MKEEITVPIYFGLDEYDKPVIDVEGIQDEFNRKLDDIIANPSNYLELDDKEVSFKRFRIDVEDMPEEVQAIDRDGALEIAHDNITIIELEEAL